MTETGSTAAHDAAARAPAGAARGSGSRSPRLSDSAPTAAIAAAAQNVGFGHIVKSLVFQRNGEPVTVLRAGDRRSDANRFCPAPATADLVHEVTEFWIGGVPPLGHEVELPTVIDESLRPFSAVWAAAGTLHDIFTMRTAALIGAIRAAVVIAVS